VIVVSLFTMLLSSAANATDSPRSVFVHAACDGKIGSAAISSLKAEIGTSQKYRLASDLSDDGRMDEVFTIYVNCTEGGNIAAFAMVYGKGKCVGPNKCHGVLDGASLRSALCGYAAATVCGQAFFKAFDDYILRPNPAELELH
jgi:hypothetical protein